MGGEMATPRPWSVVRCPKQIAKTDDRDWPWLIKYDDGGELFDLAIVQTDFAEANARLIVRAVNSFEAMREAIIAALDDYQSRCFDGETADKLRAALALADKEGE